MPHHVTQRGNRRQQTFFSPDDYSVYLDLMSQWCGEVGVRIWAYCLMPNHVHLVAVPASADGLRRAIGEAHRRYTRRVNFREGWRGHLWQGRFASFVMDESYLLAAARMWNSIRSERDWSPRPTIMRGAARAHLAGRDDALVEASPLLTLAPDWRRLLCSAAGEEEFRKLRHCEQTGRPLGEDEFLARLERSLGRILRRQRPGRKRQQTATTADN